jgi:hypothetical protein
MRTPTHISGGMPLPGPITPLRGGATPLFAGTAPLFGGTAPLFGGTAPLFGGTAPLFGGTAPLFGGTAPLFGGARLPNGRGVLPMSTTNAALASDQNRDTRRAVGPSCTTSVRRMFLVAAKNSGPLAAPSWPLRLGGSVGPAVSGPRTHHRPCGSSLGRSGASPHQSWPHRVLMTKIKIFVPCFKPFIVSL